ncbi:MAG TPA: dihydrolipoamide acetyltransferase family protein [Dehalococcoidales bacterium]|nr:dihydrolipoamide acetyltransferase family protein [Dehalococcoidales bacterium]
MAVAVIFPKLDEAMRSGKIVRWLKNEGDRVEKGETILEIETEKTAFEIEAETSGILSKIMVKAGDEVPVGATIAFILQPGEEAPEVPEPVIVSAKKKTPTEEPKAAKEPGEIKASPLARNIAKEHNIDLSMVTGTGPGGRITKEDVLQAVEEGKAVAAPPAQEEPELVEEEVVPLSSMREVIAQRMMESFQTPHFYLSVEVDTQELGKTRNQLIPIIESKTGIRLTLTDLIIKITAKALEDNPSLNCSYVDGGVKLFKRIDIGLVTAVEGGLVVPVIRQADKKSLAEIAQARAELVQKARERTLSKEEMKGSTFTISNMGMFEIDQFSAIIQPPEAAILAVGRIADKAVVRNGEILIRPMMTLTLSIDHRVLDGAMGAKFLQSLKQYLKNPFNLIM